MGSDISNDFTPLLQRKRRRIYNAFNETKADQNAEIRNAINSIFVRCQACVHKNGTNTFK